MALKLCLHGVDIARPDTFSEDVAARLGLSVVQGRLQEKEYGGNRSARFRRNRLQGAASLPYRVRTLEGILLAESHLDSLADVEISCKPGGEAQALAAVHRLLSGRDRFVLAEPDMEKRLDLLAGRPFPGVPGDIGRLKAMERHLAGQVLAISRHWHLVYSNPDNRTLARQLRVRIRRLRSCFSFFREGLPEGPSEDWKRFFRKEADSLTNLRELDVLIQACRQRETEGDASGNGGLLLDRLLQLRREEMERFYANTDLNAHTEKLAVFLLWLDAVQDVAPKRAGKETMRRFVKRKIDAWCGKFFELDRAVSDFSDMDELHGLRIRTKRFRYVTQAISPAEFPPDLHRQLKQLQDVLGLLHDDYVNAVWVRGIAAKQPEDAALQEEVRSFISWQGARSEASLVLVQDLWKQFLQMLAAYREAPRGTVKNDP